MILRAPSFTAASRSSRCRSSRALTRSWAVRIGALLVTFCLACHAQRAGSNLDFEQGRPGDIPPGWFVPKMLLDAGYSAVITLEGCRSGACAVLTVPETRPPNTFANLMNTIDGAPYRGKRVAFRAAVRVEAADPGGLALLWLRVDRADGSVGFFQNMSDRPIRSGKWAFYDIRGTVDTDAQSINYGVMVHGNARAWVDDVSLEFPDPMSDGPEVAAAREEVRKLYSRLDAAYNTGDFDFLRSIAAPEARFGSTLMKVSLPEAIADLKSVLGGGARLTYRTEIGSFELAGDEAKVRAQSAMTLTKDGETTSRAATTSDTWVRVAGAWRLKESLMVSSREVLPPTDPETARGVASELNRQVTPLSTVEAGKPYGDLRAFGEAVGDARLVCLGEATHGSHEIFQMKHRLLEYLVKEQGFTVFALEANWPESEAADRYIKTGEGDPKAALAAMYFWTWQTEEVLAMLEWMRAFNKAPGKHPVLSFTSFDMQTYNVARDRVMAYVKQYAPRELAAVEAAYSNLFTLDSGARGSPGFDEAARKAETVVSLLEARREVFTKVSAAPAFRGALQMSHIVAQAARLRTAGAGAGYRDEMMARSVEWLLKEAFPNEKIVLWAHNGHVSMAQNAGFRPMGNWLRESLGLQMYVLGFAIHSGSVRAFTHERGQAIGLVASPIPPADPGTGTAILSAAGQPLFFLDLRNRTGALAKWLSAPHLFRSCGAIWDRDNPDSFMVAETLGNSYDGLIYLENTHAARGIQP